jgi:hypothetical protein
MRQPVHPSTRSAVRRVDLTSVRRAGAAIYDPALDTLFVLGDDGRYDHPDARGGHASSDEVTVPLPMLADYGRYDVGTHEGISVRCRGTDRSLRERRVSLSGGRLRRFTARAAAVRDSMVGWLAFSFGCDWDPATRRAYVAIPNLGAVAELDYDSGRVIDFGRTYVGLRYLRFDPSRRRLYAPISCAAPSSSSMRTKAGAPAMVRRPICARRPPDARRRALVAAEQSRRGSVFAYAEPVIACRATVPPRRAAGVR